MSDLLLFKDQVKESVDLRDLFVADNHEMKRSSGAGSKCCCPFHEEKTPSCVVDAEHFYCYGCRTNGDHFDYLEFTRRLDFMEGLRYLAELANLPIPMPSPEAARQYREKREREISVRELLGQVQEWFRMKLESEGGAAARNYCNRRKLNKPDRESWGIGLAPDAEHELKSWATHHAIPDQAMLDAGLFGRGSKPPHYLYSRFRGRLMFPIHDHRGRLCGFSGRILDPEAKTAKYLNTPETDVFRKSSILYGMDKAVAAIIRDGYAIVVEGQIDVIACHSAELENTVAPLGTSFTVEHAKLVAKYTDKIVLSLDADKPGRQATRKILEVFNGES